MTKEIKNRPSCQFLNSSIINSKYSSTSLLNNSYFKSNHVDYSVKDSESLATASNLYKTQRKLLDKSCIASKIPTKLNKKFTHKTDSEIKRHVINWLEKNNEMYQQEHVFIDYERKDNHHIKTPRKKTSLTKVNTRPSFELIMSEKNFSEQKKDSIPNGLYYLYSVKPLN